LAVVRPADLLARTGTGALLLDGGMGSMLIAAGLEPGRAPEWWNLERPDRVSVVHRAYVGAGCDVIHTNSFGANPLRLAAAGLAGREREVNRAAARIARGAAAGGTLVAGDVGPTGRLFPPLGDASEAVMQEAFARQVEALAESGVDLISIETMSDLREARAAVGAALATGLAVVASMTFETRRRGSFTIMGDPLVASLQALAGVGATAVGLNCSVASSEMLAMVREAVSQIVAPLAAQPNAGRPRVAPEGVVYDTDAERFAADLAAMVGAGARLVGGCCGTTPAFIRAARGALDRSAPA
jgi:5-methyltetrahydrofolate--homocysteine methyltransferase